MASPEPSSLGATLKAARAAQGLSLREAGRRIGIRSGHLSQLETGAISRPEMAILWDLAVLLGLDFPRLLALAGYTAEAPEGRFDRQRITVALRALGELGPEDQAAAIEYMAELRRRAGH